MARLATRSRSFISTVPIVTMLPPAQRPSVRLSRCLLYTSLALSLAACGSADSTADTAAESTAASTEAVSSERCV